MYLSGIHRIFDPTAKDYTLFSAPHGAFSKFDHIIGYKKMPQQIQEVLI